LLVVVLFRHPDGLAPSLFLKDELTAAKKDELKEARSEERRKKSTAGLNTKTTWEEKHKFWQVRNPYMK